MWGFALGGEGNSRETSKCIRYLEQARTERQTVRDWNESEFEAFDDERKGRRRRGGEGEEGQGKGPRSRKGKAGALGDETSGDSTILGNDYGPAGASAVTGWGMVSCRSRGMVGAGFVR